jgi:hypothetical protein
MINTALSLTKSAQHHIVIAHVIRPCGGLAVRYHSIQQGMLCTNPISSAFALFTNLIDGALECSITLNVSCASLPREAQL